MKILLIILAFAVTFWGCEKSSEGTDEPSSSSTDDKNTDSSEEDETDETGSLTITREGNGEGNLDTSLAVNNLEVVEEDFVPGSLNVSDGSSLNLQHGGDPCEGKTLYSCQPNLLKIYVGMANRAVEQMVREITKNEDFLATLELGSAGKRDGGTTSVSIEFDINASDKYELLFLRIDTPIMHLKVDGNKYHLKRGGAGDGSSHETLVTFTDDNTWEADVRMLDNECKEQDHRAPEDIRIHMMKAAGVWQGKANMYSPRWNDGFGGSQLAKCSDTPKDEWKVVFFTDFVGNDTSTSLSVFIVPSSVETVAEVADYPMNEFCGFEEGCTPDSNAAANTNPACVKAEDSKFGGACTDSAETLIATATYSDDSYWFTPAAVSALDSGLPAKLAD